MFKLLKRRNRIKINGLNNLLSTIKSLHKIHISIKGNNNQITFPPNIKLKHCKIKIYGNNNRIILDSNSLFYGTLNIWGDNNLFHLGENAQFNEKSGAAIGTIMHPTQNAKIQIGKSSGLIEVNLACYDNDSSITIGENCMLSTNIKIWNTTTHAVINLENNQVKLANELKIGNHVWIGTDVKIGRNVQIADNSIISWGSVVNHRFNESNVIISGNPAQITHRNINWNYMLPQQYKDTHQ